MKNLCLILENLDKIRCTNGPNSSSLPVDNKRRVSVTNSVGKSSKNHKGSNMWCNYCDKSNQNTADCRIIGKFKQQKNHKACFEAKAGPGTKSLAFLVLFEEINPPQNQLKPKNIASSKKRKDESILSTEINLTTSSDEDEDT
jgi:hypothetical protein